MSQLTSSPVKASTTFRSASVSPIMGPKGLTGMKIDKKFDIPLQAHSNEARQVALGVDPIQVLQQYKNGVFHLADDIIVDYRPSTYTGFVHNQTALDELSSRIGFMQYGQVLVPRNRTAQFEHNALSARGGLFEVDIGFEWSAFSPTIDSNFEMMRALCANQMIFGKGTVMSRSVPMISDWKANMAISNDVLKHMFNTTVTGRLADMPDERANLADIRLLQNEITKQVENEYVTADSRKFLENLLQKIGFIDEMPLPKSLTVNDIKRIPVPVSVYDAMNIATEVSTHHSGGVPSNKLKAFAVSCIFDKNRQSNLMSEEIFTSTSTFNDPDRAFWAETVH